MDHRVAPASRGLVWFQHALRVLQHNPGGLIQVASAYVLIEMLPNLLGTMPDLSLAISIVLIMLFPALIAGMLHAVGETVGGRPVSVSTLFEGLRRPVVRGQLLVLGLVVLAAIMLVGLAIQRILSPEDLKILTQVANQQLKPDSPAAQAAAIPMFKALLAAAAILFVLLAGLFFAVPRVMFEGKGALSAIAGSFIACAANVLSLTVYGLFLFAASFAMAVGLAIVAGILGLLGTFGQLLFVPVMVAALVVCLLVSTSGNYLAWRDVYGRASTGVPPPQAGIIV